MPKSALALAALAASLPAQGPDVLIGDGFTRASLIRRLVDRNGDGRYDSGANLGENEAFDYYRAGGNTNFTHIEPSPFPSSPPGTLYALDGELGGTTAAPAGGIWRLHDANGNGVIEPAEATIAFDPDNNPWWTATDPEIDGMVSDGVALWWVTNFGANFEGIFRSIDLNGDGDCMDQVAGVDETTVAIGVPALDPVNGSVVFPLGNCPNTIAAVGVATINITELQTITWDPIGTPGSLGIGRFLCEDELLDQVIAFEDRNGDNDFYDAGEIYLWSGTNPNNNVDNPIFRDANPDSQAGILPVIADPGNIAIDLTGALPIYYIVNKSSGANDSNTIWRAVDANMDGDVNDAGEVRQWFRATTNDPVLPIQGAGLVAVTNVGPTVYCIADLLQPNNHDALLRIRDGNGDNVIDNATEVDVVWELPADSNSRIANLFAPGTLTPPPAGLPCMVQEIDQPACVPVGGMNPHTLQLGGLALYDETPVLGQPMTWRTTNAPLTAPTAIHIGFPFGAPIDLDIPPLGECLLGVNPITAIAGLLTDASGAVDFTFAIPFSASAVGVSVYFQSLSIDLGVNAFNVSVSNTVRAQLGTADYCYTIPW